MNDSFSLSLASLSLASLSRLFLLRLSLSLQHMCSLESELENQMGEFHIKMKGESFSHPPLTPPSPTNLFWPSLPSVLTTSSLSFSLSF